MTDRDSVVQIGPAPKRFVAFAGPVCVATGELAEVAAAAWRAQDTDPQAAILVFDRETADVVELDLRGTEHEVAARYRFQESGPAQRGRPKLGVVAREVTLLPRHWDWLARQPGGASITLRKLVEAARKSDAGAARARMDAAYRFMWTMAGNLPGFEEAARALFAGDRPGLGRWLAPWPEDIGAEVLRFLDGSPA
jgi:hypothetical protein